MRQGEIISYSGVDEEAAGEASRERDPTAADAEMDESTTGIDCGFSSDASAILQFQQISSKSKVSYTKKR